MGLKVEYEELDGWIPQSEIGIKSPKVYFLKQIDRYYLRCYNCGQVSSIRLHQEAGMVHVKDGIVDIRGDGSHSIMDTGCGAHYHIYAGEVVPA